MSDILISVVVPIYNSCNSLEHCISTILCQSHRFIEVICVDDKSSDGSREILQTLAKKDQRIKLILLDYNVGAAKARNIGIDASLGKYIGFIDSDDEILDKDMYRKLLFQCECHGLDFCKSRLIVNRLGKETAQTELLNNYYTLENKFELIPFAPSIVAGLYNGDFLKKFNVNYGNYKIGSHDVIFHLSSLFYARKIGYINDICYRYNFLSNSTSISSSRNPDDIIFVFSKVVLKLYNELLNDKKISFYLMTAAINYFNYYVRYGYINKSNFKKMNKIIKLLRKKIHEEDLTTDALLYSEKYDVFLQKFYKRLI